MSDHPAYAFPPAAGYGAYVLLRGIWGLLNDPKDVAPPPVPSKPVVAKLHPAPSPQVPIPIVPWTGERELLAWRAWRLAILLDDDVDRTGPRLLSLSAPCIWEGPVIRTNPPRPPVQPLTGIYTLKRDAAERVDWRMSEHVWVTGWVALSGHVIEHALGYRAERVVIRELRLGVGTHLAVRPLDMLRDVTARLEERYQAPVDAGIAERRIAGKMLARGFKPECPELRFVWDKPPWRLV